MKISSLLILSLFVSNSLSADIALPPDSEEIKNIMLSLHIPSDDQGKIKAMVSCQRLLDFQIVNCQLKSETFPSDTLQINDDRAKKLFISLSATIGSGSTGVMGIDYVPILFVSCESYSSGNCIVRRYLDVDPPTITPSPTPYNPSIPEIGHIPPPKPVLGAQPPSGSSAPSSIGDGTSLVN